MLTQLHQQGGEEARLTVSRCEDVAVRDEDAATLVLGEQAQPGGLLDQHLPGPVPECRLLPSDYSALASQRPHSAVFLIIPGNRSGS